MRCSRRRLARVCVISAGATKMNPAPHRIPLSTARGNWVTKSPSRSAAGRPGVRDNLVFAGIKALVQEHVERLELFIGRVRGLECVVGAEICLVEPLPAVGGLGRSLKLGVLDGLVLGFP